MRREFLPFSAASHGRTLLVTWFGQPDKFRISSKDGLNATVVKDTNAILVGWHLFNRTVSNRYLHFYDQATQPKPDDEIDWILTLPPDSVSNMEFVSQIPFFNGLAFTICGDHGPVKAGDVEGVLLYA